MVMKTPKEGGFNPRASVSSALDNVKVESPLKLDNLMPREVNKSDFRKSILKN
jgi:hypothetical protein